jgi:tetratricopeptide (TPR) repeat protein
MDPKTLELLRDLQADVHDEASFKRIRDLLRGQRRGLVNAHDQTTLGELSELLEAWAEAAETAPLRASALREAADILQRDLHRPERANELRRRAQEAIAEAEQGRVGAASYVALAQRRVASGELDGAIDAYERALAIEADPQVVRSLAELYVRRSGPEDAPQAADLYYTLGDVLGNPDGIVMLERALTQVPDHAEARALLEQYRAGQRPRPGAPASPEPPPLLINVPLPLGTPIRASAPQLIAAAAQRARFSAPAPVSSLAPVVRSEAPAPTLEARPRRKRARWIASAGAVAAAAAALGLFVAAPRGADRASSLTAGASVPVTQGHTIATTPSTAPAATATANAASPTNGMNATKPDKEPAEAASKPAQATNPTADGTSKPAAPAPHPAETANPSDPNAQQPASGPTVHALVELMTVRGGKLAETKLTAAIDTLLPKIDKCYALTLKQKPRVRGRLNFAWTVKPSGKVVAVRLMGGTIKDPELTRCSAEAIGATHFPKPHKQAAQVKLPLEFRRS